MAIVEGQKVKVKWNGRNKNHFIDKGYMFTKFREEFYVDVNDLTDGSNYIVDVRCDSCHRIKQLAYCWAIQKDNHFCDYHCEKNFKKDFKQHLIDEFYRFYEENQRYPQQQDMKVSKGYPSYHQYLTEFGSWNNLLHTLNIKEYGEKWLNQDIEVLKRMYESEPKDEIINNMVNRYSWGHICNKARELGLRRNYREPSKKRMSRDFLISEFWRYYREFGVYPRRKDIANTEGYPSASVYASKWKSWNDFLKEIGVIEKDNTDGWYIIDENVVREKYSEESQENIINSLMVKRSWSTIKAKASKLGLTRNRSLTRRKFSKDDLLNKLVSLADELGRTPRDADIRELEEFPSAKVFQKYFGSWNKALKLAGLELNTEFDVTRDDVLKRAKQFYIDNNRSPYWNELGISTTVYSKYWSNINELLVEAGLPINKKTRNDQFKTDDELLEDYINLYNELDRIPISNDINNEENMASFSTYKLRFGSYEKIWELCNIDYKSIINKDNKYGFLCLDKNGDICRSYAEMVITNLLIDNGIKYIKEKKYIDLISNISDKRYAMDWYLPDYEIAIEYFGIYRKEHLNEDNDIGSYTRKAELKKKLCRDNHIKLLDLYQEDLNQKYLDRLTDKFSKFGIRLLVENKNLYKNRK